ncbi:hypothetical protein GCM10027615_70170 [Plantactinospora veratri]
MVAFGGGHGLAASLRALRRCAPELDLDITAVVTVGDDGGSSGRLRLERGALPPATCGRRSPRSPPTSPAPGAAPSCSSTGSQAPARAPTRWPGTRSATWCSAG